MVEELRRRLGRVVEVSFRRLRKKILVVRYLLWRLLREFGRFLGIRIQRRIEFGK
jgi:hypothetical protein